MPAIPMQMEWRSSLWGRPMSMRRLARRIYSGKTGALLFTFRPDSTGGHFGASVSAAGDINGDGTPDIAVGAPDVRSRAGAVYLYSGRDGALIRRLDGAAAGDEFGFAPASIPIRTPTGSPTFWSVHREPMEPPARFIYSPAGVGRFCARLQGAIQASGSGRPSMCP